MKNADENEVLNEIPEGWLTAAAYRKKNGGNNQSHNKRLSELRDSLIEDAVDGFGLSSIEAEEMVAELYVGIFLNDKGGKVLAASPEGWGKIEEQKIPEGWWTASSHKKMYGGSVKRINVLLESLSEKLIDDELAAGLSPSEAAEKVAKEYVGKFLSKKGVEVFAASPKGWAELLEKHPKMKRIPELAATKPKGNAEDLTCNQR